MTFQSREELEHQVVMLHRDRMSVRAIARALRLGRNNVKKILEKHAVARIEPHGALPPRPVRAPRPSKLDRHHARVKQLLEAYEDITAQRVFEILKDEGYDGRLTVVKDHVRRVRPKKRPKVSQPVAAPLPGQLAECDWSPVTVRFTHAPAKTLQVFGYTVRYSHRKYYGFYPTSDIHALMDGHVQVFSTFGALAKRCKYDNQKAVVLRWEGRQPLYNARFIDFATFYEYQVEACRPFHPDDKPGVEASFRALKTSFFNGRTFRDEDDLKAQLAHWQATVCDVRPHKKVKRTPLELFEEERPHLLALPVHHYDTARIIYRVCDPEGFVAWKGNRYGVPTEHVTDLLPVRVTQSEIVVYATDLSCIARHGLHPAGAGDDVPGLFHRPAARRGADLDQLRRAFQDLGEPAARFLQGVEAAQPRSAAYHARLVLLLRERFSTRDLVSALAHAVQFGAFEHAAVERILVARASPRCLDEYVAEATAKKLLTVLGESETSPRELEEYDRLPCFGRPERTDPCPPNEPPQPNLPETTACVSDSQSISDDSD